MYNTHFCHSTPKTMCFILVSAVVCLLLTSHGVVSRAEWTREEPRLPDHSLLNMGKHVGALSFKIWKSMQDHVKSSE